MDTKIKILILSLFTAFNLFGQSPLSLAVRYNITSATGGDPYTVVGVVSDDLSRFTGSDIAIGDSLYVIDGSDLYVLKITAINSVVGPTVNLIADDPSNAGISIPTGQSAIVRPTPNYKLPIYISGLRDDLRSMMMNRQAKIIDQITGGGASSITDFISAGVAVPPAASASSNTGETWRNMSTGELWASNGTKWYPFTYGPKECVDTVTVSLITVQSGGSVTTGSPLIKNTSGVWEHMYNHPSGLNLIPDGVITDVITGPRAIIQYCGIRKGSGATPNTSYYVNQSANTGFTTTKPTTNIRPLGKVSSNGDFLVNAGLLFSRDNLANAVDSTFAKTNGTYPNRRITDNIYKNGTLGIATTDTSARVNLYATSLKSGLNFKSDTSGYMSIMDISPVIPSNPNLSKFRTITQNFVGINLPISTRPNYVLRSGYNFSNGGGRLVLTEPALGLEYETYWANASTGTLPVTEFHIVQIDTLGTTRRLFSNATSRGGGGYSSTSMTMAKLVFKDYGGTDRVSYDFNAGTVTHNGGVVYNFNTNNQSILNQKAAGSGTLYPMIKINATDELELAPAQNQVFLPSVSFRYQTTNTHFTGDSGGFIFGKSGKPDKLTVFSPADGGIIQKGVSDASGYEWRVGTNRLTLLDNSTGKVPISVYRPSGGVDKWLVLANNYRVGFYTDNPLCDMEIRTTGSMLPPHGTTAQRPTGTLINGAFRYNSTIRRYEYADSIVQDFRPLITYASNTITGAAFIAVGNTAERPTGARGYIRNNLQTGKFEGVRVGTSYETFFQLGDTLSATSGQVLGWNGSTWLPVTNLGNTSWQLTGNSVTAGTQFLGSTNNVSLRFRTNNVQRAMIDSTGNVGIANNAPTEKLDVAGNIRFSGALMPNNTAGTSGQVLTSAGAGTVPTWTTNTSESTSIGSFNNSGTSNGLSLSGTALSLHAATISTPGAVNVGQQTFGVSSGTKLFNGTGSYQIDVDGDTDNTPAGITFTQLGGADQLGFMYMNSADANNASFRLSLEEGGALTDQFNIGTLNDTKGIQERGGLYEDVTSVTTSPYTVLYGDRNIYLDGTSITVNLQAIGTAAGETKVGRVIYFFNDNATNVTITPNGSETINDSASLTLLPNTGVTLLAVTGTKWITRD